MNLIWSRKDLSPQKLGTFGEYYAKMTMASYGMSIYTSEVDDHGIDFVAEFGKRFLKFQVKTIRNKTSYIFMKAKDFDTSDPEMFLLVILLEDGVYPEVYMIPATDWNNPEKTMLVYHEYKIPEYGINISKKNAEKLEEYNIKYFIKDNLPVTHC